MDRRPAAPRLVEGEFRPRPAPAGIARAGRLSHQAGSRTRRGGQSRIQKTLKGANIKLASVASDPLGLSRRQMLVALVAGSTDTTAMAELARGKMRAKRGPLERAQAGRMATHQRFLLTEQLCHIDALDESIARLSAEIGQRMRPFAEELERLDTIPGIGRRMAEILVAEIGTDMSRFPSAAHLASWAGMCPGNQESAGKRKSGKRAKGTCGYVRRSWSQRTPWAETALPIWRPSIAA